MLKAPRSAVYICRFCIHGVNQSWAVNTVLNTKLFESTDVDPIDTESQLFWEKCLGTTKNVQVFKPVFHQVLLSFHFVSKYFYYPMISYLTHWLFWSMQYNFICGVVSPSFLLGADSQFHIIEDGKEARYVFNIFSSSSYAVTARTVTLIFEVN